MKNQEIYSLGFMLV